MVFFGVTDPVGLGLVASLGHPGGNMTGLAMAVEDGIAGKWVELLKETVPRLARVGVLWNPDARGLEGRVTEVATGAARLGITLHKLPVHSVDDLAGASSLAGAKRLFGAFAVGDVHGDAHQVFRLAGGREVGPPTGHDPPRAAFAEPDAVFYVDGLTRLSGSLKASLNARRIVGMHRPLKTLQADDLVRRIPEERSSLEVLLTFPLEHVPDDPLAVPVG